ncbi:MAG: methanogenesis marker protein Mmp4/MtxX [Promethearchaeota archaeon]
MTFLTIFKTVAKNNKENIGVGLGELEDHNIKVFKACLQFLKEFTSTLLLFGNEKAISQIKNSKLYEKSKQDIKFISSGDPENEIFQYLKNNKINAAVRGNFSSNKFLTNLKEFYKISEVYRLALLETYDGTQFFYAPVGIDECNSIDQKITFVEKAIKLLISLKIDPKVSILSGGRLSDKGRDHRVDESINSAEEVVKFLGLEFSNVLIYHDEILIENAISNKANIIIAPDGISGNLIYRTLVHLGGGKAYGAIYMDIKPIIIDTSRVGDLSEIYGALVLALALIR